MNKNINYQKNNIFTLLAPSIKTALFILVLFTGSFTTVTQAVPARKRQYSKNTAKKMRAPIAQQIPKIANKKNIRGKANPIHATAKKATPTQATVLKKPKKRTIPTQAAQRQHAAKNAQLTFQRKKQIQGDAQLAQRLQAAEELAAHTQHNRKAAIKAMATQQVRKNHENRWRQQQPVRQQNPAVIRANQRQQAVTPKHDMSPPHVSK